MRNAATKERRRDRYELVYMLRDFITDHLNNPSNDADIINFVKGKIRPVLAYSCKTNDIDIWITLKRDYQKILQRQ